MELTAAAWRGYRREDFPVGSWAVEDGTLHAVTAGERIDLISRSRYRDFVLTLEWRLPVGGNSGVLYRVSEEASSSWQSGPEMQLLDDLGHPDGQNELTRCGALYGLVAPREVALPLMDVFTQARIVVRGSKVEHWLAGRQVVGCDMAAPPFMRRIAVSKFKDFPRFAREDEGHIVLQHHGTDAWFRHLRIEPLHAVNARKPQPG